MDNKQIMPKPSPNFAFQPLPLKHFSRTLRKVQDWHVQELGSVFTSCDYTGGSWELPEDRGCGTGAKLLGP